MEPGRFLALKILTTHATALNKKGHLHEIDMLEKISALDANSFLPFLVDRFEISGPYGTHIALALTPLTTDLESFRQTAPAGKLPLHKARTAIFFVLEGLVKLHSLGIIHTGAHPCLSFYYTLLDAYSSSSSM